VLNATHVARKAAAAAPESLRIAIVPRCGS
jgi:hypothetical protein